jgi:hypothetical protein
MKNKLLPAIDVVIKPSLLLLSALSAISILSCLGVSILPIPFLIKLLLLALIIFSTVYYSLRDALLLLPWSWHRIEVSSDGQLKLTNMRGEQFNPSLEASIFIHSYLVIMNVKPLGFNQKFSTLQLHAVVLFTEPACQQQRQLRVWLRWWKHDVADKLLGNIA